MTQGEGGKDEIGAPTIVNTKRRVKLGVSCLQLQFFVPETPETVRRNKETEESKRGVVGVAVKEGYQVGSQQS